MKQGTRLEAIATFRAGKRTFKPGVKYWITANQNTHSSTVPAGAAIVGNSKDSIGQGICLTLENIEKLFNVIN